MAQAVVTPVRSGVGALAHIAEAAIAPLLQLVQKVQGVVLQLVPPAAAHPAFERLNSSLVSKLRSSKLLHEALAGRLDAIFERYVQRAHEVDLVQHADVVYRSLVKERHSTAGVAHPLHKFLARLLGALSVQQHAHLHVGPGAIERVGHALKAPFSSTST